MQAINQSQKNKTCKSPITTIQGQPEPMSFDYEIHLPKTKLFAEYYHHNENFEILFLNNPECCKARSCIACKLTFTKDNPVLVPDVELNIMHKERYELPAKDCAGKFLPMIITNHLGRKFYCTKKYCLLLRHPEVYVYG